MDDNVQAAGGCHFPPELDDLALIAAIDGEADAEVVAHLRTCPHCAGRARHFADLQGLLRQQFFRMFCPASDTLVAFQQGLLAGDQYLSVAATSPSARTAAVSCSCSSISWWKGW